MNTSSILTKMKLGILQRVFQKTNFSISCARLTTNVHKLNEANIVRSRIPSIEVDNSFTDEYIWEKIDKWSDKTAMVCGETGKTYTYSKLYRESRAVANYLRNKIPGLKEKDVVAVCLQNIPEYAVIVLGIIQAGLKVTTINPNYTSGEILQQFVRSDTKFVFTMNKLWPQVKQAVQELPFSVQVAVTKQQQDESIPLGAIDFSEMAEGDIEMRYDLNRNLEDVVIIPFSSGTTGLPKGVEITHKGIVANICQANTPSFKLLREAEGSFQEVVPLVLPMSHAYGLISVLFNGLVAGCKIITLPKFSQEAFFRTLDTHRPTFGYLVPSLVSFLIQHNKVLPRHIKQFSIMISASAPLTSQDIARFYEKSNHTTSMLQMYGATEATALIHTQTPHIENGVKPGSAGLVVPNTEFIVVPPEGSDRVGLPPNTSGEVLIRGPQVMKGYYKNPEATRATIDDNGWLRTGDIAHYDDDGHLFVTDRIKDLIKVKGFQIAPAELEAILRSHPDVMDAAVIGIPHNWYGEIPKAFIVTKNNSPANSSRIQEFVNSKVASYKHLRGGIVTLENIPKTLTGKILKRELKNL